VIGTQKGFNERGQKFSAGVNAGGGGGVCVCVCMCARLGFCFRALARLFFLLFFFA